MDTAYLASVYRCHLPPGIRLTFARSHDISSSRRDQQAARAVDGSQRPRATSRASPSCTSRSAEQPEDDSDAQERTERLDDATEPAVPAEGVGDAHRSSSVHSVSTSTVGQPSSRIASRRSIWIMSSATTKLSSYR